MKKEQTEFLVPVEINTYMPLWCEDWHLLDLCDPTVVKIQHYDEVIEIPCYAVDGEPREPVAYVLLSSPTETPEFLEDPYAELKPAYRCSAPLRRRVHAMVADVEGKLIKMQLRPVLSRVEHYHEPNHHITYSGVLTEKIISEETIRSDVLCKRWKEKGMWLLDGHHSTSFVVRHDTQVSHPTEEARHIADISPAPSEEPTEDW